MIKATKDNQEFYFKNFLDCLRYFLANGNKRATKKDVNYSKYQAAFIRSKYKHQFEFALVEKIEAKKVDAFRHQQTLFALNNELLLVPFSSA